MSRPAVHVEVEGGIQLVVIQRASVRNAIDMEVAEQLAAAMIELDARSDLHVGILTGEGENFCSGMNLKAFASEGQEPAIAGRGFAGLCEAPPRKPLIAAVEGYAVAGGFEIALTCDMIVAARNAQFGLPEVKRGLVASSGGLMRLAHRLPRNLAMEMALVGDPLSAEQAFALGLVNRLVETGNALAEAKVLAQRIIANAPLAVGASKRIVNSSRTWTDPDMFELQRPIATEVNGSSDAREGARAFAEKRAAIWQGC